MPDTVISVGGDIRDIISKLEAVEKKVGGVADKAREKSKGGGLLDGVVGKAGGFLAGVVGLQQLKGVIDDFDRIGDLATRLGVTAESIQRVGRQAKLSGSDVESVVAALTKLRKNIEGGGDDKASKALADLGVNAADLLKLEPDQQIILLADAFQKAQASGTGFVALQDLLGKGFVDLLPLLRTSREELKKLAAEPVVSEKNIQLIQDFNDRLDNAVANVKVGLVEGVDGVVTQLYLYGTALTEGLDAAGKLGKQLVQDERDQLELKKKELETQREAAALAAQQAEAKAKQDEADKIGTENEKKKAEIAFDSLTTAEKLEEIYRRIAEVNQRAEELRNSGKNDPVAAAKLEGELIDLFKTETDLKKKAADEREREADAAKRAADQAKREAKAAQEKVQRQVESQRSLGSELAVLKARASGREKLAQQLEREERIRQNTKKIADDTGLPPAQARQIAEEKEKLQDRIEGRKRGKIYGAKSSTGFGGLAELYAKRDKPLRDSFQFGGLDAFKKSNERDANGNLVVPIGKGFGKELVRQSQHTQATQAKIADPTALLQQAVEELRGVRQALNVVN